MTSSRIRAKRHLEITTATMNLCLQKGLDSVSIRDITSACNLTSASFYTHFKSRSDLFRHMFLGGYQDYGKDLKQISETCDNPLSGIFAMISYLCRKHDDDTARFRFLLLNQHHGLAFVGADNPHNPIAILSELVHQHTHNNATFKAIAVAGVLVQTATALLYGRLKGAMSHYEQMMIKTVQAILIDT